MGATTSQGVVKKQTSHSQQATKNNLSGQEILEAINSIFLSDDEKKEKILYLIGNGHKLSYRDATNRGLMYYAITNATDPQIIELLLDRNVTLYPDDQLLKSLKRQIV